MTEGRSVVPQGQGQRKEWNAKRHEESFESKENVLYSNYGGGFTGIYNCQNS